jgi:hypothetical protein
MSKIKVMVMSSLNSSSNSLKYVLIKLRLYLSHVFKKREEISKQAGPDDDILRVFKPFMYFLTYDI